MGIKLKIEDSHIKMLEQSAIETCSLIGSGVFSADQEEAKELVNSNSSGLAFSYFDLEGKIIGHRLRLDNPIKDCKYLQRSGTHLNLYFHKNDLSLLHDSSTSIYITEGEKKVLALRQHVEGAVIAPPGAYGWSHENDLAPIWKKVPVEGREIHFLPDSDFFSNKRVFEAGEKLIKHLVNRGATINLIDIRSDKTDEKVGVDDFILLQGKDDLSRRLQNPLWTFKNIDVDKLPRKYKGCLEGLIRGSIFISSIKQDEVISVLSKCTIVSKTAIKKEFDKARDAWASLKPKAIRPKNLICWNKASETVDSVVTRIGESVSNLEDCYIESGSDELLYIKNNQAKRFTDGLDFSIWATRRINYATIRYNSDGEGKLEHGTLPPVICSSFLLDVKDVTSLKEISFHAESPCLIGEEIIHNKGYYEKSKVLYTGPEIKPIPGLFHTTKALNYPYADEASRVNTLGALLGSIFMRGEFAGSHPMLLLQADGPNAGKSMLADTFSLISNGKMPGSVSYKANDVEFEKEIASHILNSSFLKIDNIRNGGRQIESGTLERCLTDRILNFRLLGSNKIIKRLNDVVFMATCNSGMFSPDLVTRSVLIELSLAKRKEAKSVRWYAEKYRLEILGELLNLVINWKNKGCKSVPVTFDKYPTWADKVNGILKANGIHGFLENHENVSNKLDAIASGIVETGEEARGEEKKTPLFSPKAMRERFEQCMGISPLRDIPSNRGKDIKIGNYLKKMVDKEYPIIDEGETRILMLKSIKNPRRGKNATDYYFELKEPQNDGSGPKSAEWQNDKTPLLNETFSEITQLNHAVTAFAECSECFSGLGDDNLEKNKKNYFKPPESGKNIPNIPNIQQFSKTINIVGKELNGNWWKGSYIGDKFAFDAETTLIEHEGHTPDYILGSVFNGNEIFFLKKEDIKSFTEVHQDSTWIAHNASFDLAVLAKVLGSKEQIFRLIDKKKVCCSMLLAKLVHIANGGNWDKKNRNAKEKKEMTSRFSLATQAARRLDLSLDKHQELDGEKIRTSYEKYKDNIEALPAEYLEYNALDSYATYHLWDSLKEEAELICDQNGVDKELLLSHWSEVEKAWAAKLTSLVGVRVDLKALEDVSKDIVDEYEILLKEISEKYGYSPGKGSTDRFQAAMAKAQDEAGEKFIVKYNKTKKKDLFSASKDHLTPFAHVPFIGLYIKFSTVETLRNTFANKLKSHIRDGKIHPRINTCLDTGRVSFSAPNLQQLPRPTKDIDLRRFIIPPHENHVFYGVDNTAAELVALADRCVREFGHSNLSDAINDGKDIHRLTAATVTGKKYEEATKAERQQAKAINFGFPGGLGAKSFVSYAKVSYGVEIEEKDAKELKEKWLSAYPELRKYLQMGTEQIVKKLPSTFENCTKKQSYYILKDVVSGKNESRFGRVYGDKERVWAWETMLKLLSKYPNVFGRLEADIRSNKASEELAREIDFLRTATLPSGRIRGRCTYNNFSNNAFQGAQADIAGTAWYQLWRNGFEVPHMVHDELQISLPDDDTKEEKAKQIDKIILDAAKKWCPNTQMRIESEFSPHWKK